MMAFCPEHPKWDQNSKFTLLIETTSIPTPFICRVLPPPRPPSVQKPEETLKGSRVFWGNTNSSEGIPTRCWFSHDATLKLKLKNYRSYQRGEFHISHDASRQISVFSPRWKERSRVSREIFNDLNFKMQLIQGKFQWALLIFGIWLIM